MQPIRELVSYVLRRRFDGGGNAGGISRVLEMPKSRHVAKWAGERLNDNGGLQRHLEGLLKKFSGAVSRFSCSGLSLSERCLA